MVKVVSWSLLLRAGKNPRATHAEVAEVDILGANAAEVVQCDLHFLWQELARLRQYVERAELVPGVVE